VSVAAEPRSGVFAPAPRPAPEWPHTLGAVVRRGLLDRRRAVLTWGLSLGVYGGFMAAIYPSIQSSMDQMLKSYPEALKQAFDVGAMDTVEGYLHAEMFSLIVPLAIAFFAIRAVANPIVGAEERGHLDITLTLPISRAVLIGGAYIVAALDSAAIMLITGAITFIAGTVAGTDVSLGLVTAGVVGVWPLALFFGGVSGLVAGAMHSSRAATGIALVTMMGMYAVDIAGRLAHGIEPIRWASAFRYYGAPMRDGIDVLGFAGLTAAAILLLGIGTALFERRDVLH
jgi:ABC-2 type transport system permease protein